MTFKIEEVPDFYKNYISHVIENGLIESLKKSSDELNSTCSGLDESQALYRYADNKSSIKDLIQHLIDSERVFSYRAMRFARNDKTELSGFDHNSYVDYAFADKYALIDLLKYFNNIRQSSIDLFTNLSESELSQKGISNGVEMSVDMIGYIISGHTFHHLAVIKEKYI